MPARGRRTRDLCTRAEIKDFEERRNARAGASYPRPGQQVFVALALRRVEMPARGRRTRDVMQVDLRDMQAAESKCPRGGVVPATRTSVSILRWRRTVEMPARGRRTRDTNSVGSAVAIDLSKCPRGGVVPATGNRSAGVPSPPHRERRNARAGASYPRRRRVPHPGRHARRSKWPRAGASYPRHPAMAAPRLARPPRAGMAVLFHFRVKDVPAGRGFLRHRAGDLELSLG